MILSELLADVEPSSVKTDVIENKLIAYARRLKPKTQEDMIEIMKMFERNRDCRQRWRFIHKTRASCPAPAYLQRICLYISDCVPNPNVT